MVERRTLRPYQCFLWVIAIDFEHAQLPILSDTLRTVPRSKTYHPKTMDCWRFPLSQLRLSPTMWGPRKNVMALLNGGPHRTMS